MFREGPREKHPCVMNLESSNSYLISALYFLPQLAKYIMKIHLLLFGSEFRVRTKHSSFYCSPIIYLGFLSF